MICNRRTILYICITFVILIVLFLLITFIIMTTRKAEQKKEQKSNEYLSNFCCNNNLYNKKIKILYIIGVENSTRNVSLMRKNYNVLKNFNDITWCFNHFDGSNQLWKKEPWYNNMKCIKNVGVGSKIIQWLKITPKIANEYDYLWFSDGDMGLEHFDWTKYRSMLINLNPILSQPGILPSLSGRASDHHWLCQTSVNKNTIKISDKNIEIMTPFISTKIWSLVYEKMLLTDKRAARETEYFFNKINDDLDSIKIINFMTPLVHHDFRNLTSIKSVKAKRKSYHSPNPENYEQKLRIVRQSLVH